MVSYLQLYDRRLKLCMTRKERKHWGQINDLYMSEESDDGEGSFRVHSPSWRSQSKFLSVPML